MKTTLTAFTVMTALAAGALTANAQEQATPETGDMMQNEGAMQGGMMNGDMMGMMQMMSAMQPMMEECTKMMASMNENMDGGMMPSDSSEG